MIEIELPDGSIAEFPDGTSPDVIKGALQKRFGAQQEPESQASMDARGQLSAMTQNPAKAMYDQMPGWQKPLQAADDVVRTLANGMTFGFADKIAAGGDPERLAMERAMTQAAKDRSSGAGTAAEIVGNIATGSGLARQGATLAGRFGTGAMEGMKGLAARTGLMGVEGAGYGVASALGNDQNVGTGAAIGALGGTAGNLLGEGLSAGVSKVAGAFNKKPPMVSVDDLKAQAKAAYDKAEQTGVMFTPQAMQRLANETSADYASMGYHPGLQPRAGVVMDELNRLAPQNVGLTGLETARKMAGNAIDPTNPASNALVGGVRQRIDDLMMNPQAGDVFGDSAAASGALKQGRELWRRARNVEKLNEMFGRGELNAATSGSGGNLQNATRQQIKRALTTPNIGKTFTADEKKAIEGFVKGSTGQNILRAIGQASPSGNGMGKMIWGLGGLGAGAGIGLPAAAGVGALAATSAGAKKAAEALTRSRFGVLERSIASGAPKATKNAVQRLAEAKRETIARMLMNAIIGQTVTP